MKIPSLERYNLLGENNNNKKYIYIKTLDSGSQFTQKSLMTKNQASKKNV